jgi:hypothetical protein
MLTDKCGKAITSINNVKRASHASVNIVTDVNAEAAENVKQFLGGGEDAVILPPMLVVQKILPGGYTSQITN